MRGGKPCGRLERFTICPQRRCGGCRAEMPCETVAHAERAGIARACTARAEQPDRWQLDVRGHCPHAMKEVILREVPAGEREQLLKLRRELLGVEWPHGSHGLAVRAWRTADAQIDAAGIQGFQRVERFSNAERRVVR